MYTNSGCCTSLLFQFLCIFHSFIPELEAKHMPTLTRDNFDEFFFLIFHAPLSNNREKVKMRFYGANLLGDSTIRAKSPTAVESKATKCRASLKISNFIVQNINTSKRDNIWIVVVICHR